MSPNNVCPFLPKQGVYFKKWITHSFFFSNLEDTKSALTLATPRSRQTDENAMSLSCRSPDFMQSSRSVSSRGRPWPLHSGAAMAA